MFIRIIGFSVLLSLFCVALFGEDKTQNEAVDVEKEAWKRSLMILSKEALAEQIIRYEEYRKGDREREVRIQEGFARAEARMNEILLKLDAKEVEVRRLQRRVKELEGIIEANGLENDSTQEIEAESPE